MPRRRDVVAATGRRAGKDVISTIGDPEEGSPIAVESPLECPLIDPTNGDDLGISLFGFVDLVLNTTHGPVIVDFKTSARSSAPLDVAHEIQLSCYAYAFRQVFGVTEHEMQIRSLIKTKAPKGAQGGSTPLPCS